MHFRSTSVLLLLGCASVACSDDSLSGGGGNANTGSGANSGSSESTKSGSPNGSGSAAGGSTGAFIAGAGGSAPTCTGLQCQVHSCNSPTLTTTISGKIYDPAGKNPLYGAVAYVPNTKPADFTPGASCYTCGDLYTGDPIAADITKADGSFTISKAPDGKDIPLVIQVGKWRRQFVLPAVSSCTDTAVPDKQLTLPKNGSEGDLPNIAISTGGSDTLECLLPRIGIDKAEYSPGGGGTGHVHIFKGEGGPDTSPGAPDSPDALWDKAEDIMPYDLVLLSCEGKETKNMNQQVLFDYAKGGGRVFASHFHYAWFNTGPFGNANLATWTTDSQDIGDIQADVVTTTWDAMPFARGQAMQDWLNNTKALTNNKLPIKQARHNADVSVANTPSQPWITVDANSNGKGGAQDFTFDTPLGADPATQCGRVAFSDMHVGAASGDYKNKNTTPEGCADADLSPQEKALEFILFDLSSCVTPNNMTQPPPSSPPE